MQVDENDGIIEGINRLEIAAEFEAAGKVIEVPTVVRKGLSFAEKRTLCEELNWKRRQASAADLKKRKEERLERVAKHRKAAMSVRRIADREHVSPETISQDVKECIKRGMLLPETEETVVKGKDGTKQKKGKPKGKAKAKAAKAAANKPEAPLVDANGTQIPKKLRDTFADRWHVGTSEVLRKLAKEVKGVYRWNVRLDPEVENDLKRAIDRIDAATPHSVCKACLGEGCPACLNAGFVTNGAK